jgi:hypothetical protein
VPAYNSMHEGDIDPVLNKRIDTLILSDTNFIVYLDQDLFVEWSYSTSYGELPDEAGEVLNRVSLLEAIPIGHLSIDQIRTFRRLVGEGVARLLGEHDSRASISVLDKAQSWISARNGEYAKRWYIEGSMVAWGLFSIGALLLWVFRQDTTAFLGRQAFDVLLAAAAGANGTLLSVLLRSGSLTLDASAGKQIHYIDGASRVLAGAMGSVFLALAILSKLFLGPLLTSESLSLLLVVAMVGGTSERLIPSLISRIELSISDAKLVSTGRTKKIPKSRSSD